MCAYVGLSTRALGSTVSEASRLCGGALQACAEATNNGQPLASKGRGIFRAGWRPAGG